MRKTFEFVNIIITSSPSSMDDFFGNSNQSDTQAQLPSIELPSGGGSINGIGEKFQTNAVTGTSSMSIPIAISSGRSALTPGLSVSYNSGSGNSLFGYGWSLSVPSIKRKTARGLPQYKDSEESDVFLLSEAEDLVPVLLEDGGSWIRDEREEDGYFITRYRPRIEGLYARIENWKDQESGAVHWQTVSREGVTSLFGESSAAKVFDPAQEDHIFEWLLEKRYDAHGNSISYSYEQENLEGIDSSLVHEQSRLGNDYALGNKYISRIQYGNKLAGDDSDYHFTIAFDYGQYDDEAPSLSDANPWRVRQDPFSTYRSGFELRTYRLCDRVLVFHDFDELGEEPVLVKSTDFFYNESTLGTFLAEAIQLGYKQAELGGYSSKAFPPLAFTYTEAPPDDEVHIISSAELPKNPNQYQWVDMEGEGLPGLLTTQEDGWYYRPNRGDGTFDGARLLSQQPSPARAGLASPRIVDIDGDGRKELLLQGRADGMEGYFDYNQGQWETFKILENQPNINWQDPNMKLIDLNGDGYADILITEDDVLRWFPSKAKSGYDAGEYVPKGHDEEQGPTLVFSDGDSSIYLADMSGDGLTDLVRIKNGEVCYWPNKGYARFGSKIVMSGSPVFDYLELFDQKQIRLGDINGSGMTDILYLGGGNVSYWLNESGNGWGESLAIASFPDVDDLSSVGLVDLLGLGTACLVWNSPLSKDEPNEWQYIDLSGGQKPYLLSTIDNNMGKRTTISYGASTQYYLDDLRAGTPWITPLHFPVQVVASITVEDLISGSRLTTSYKYHHGYYDGIEREFRGFGMVEQTDAESFETYNTGDELDMAPVYTKSWFHTGAYVDQGVISRQYEAEYFDGDAMAAPLADSVIEGADMMSFEATREAYRSLKGRPLRVETYALDGSERQNMPYNVAETNYAVTQIQPHEGLPHAVFHAVGRESLTHHYERELSDPRIQHTFNLEIDEYGHILKTVNIAYPRRSSVSSAYDEQTELKAVAQLNELINNTEDFYLLGVPLQQRSFEVNGFSLETDAYFSWDNISSQLEGLFEDAAILSHNTDFTTGVQSRLLSWTKNYYWLDESTEAQWGEVSALVLGHHTEQVVMSTNYPAEVFGDMVDGNMLNEASYIESDGYWWIPSSIMHYHGATAFYRPYRIEDPFGNLAEIGYDAYNLAIIQSSDALGNTSSAAINYRTLAPWQLVDMNNNTSETISDALGMVIATSSYGSVDGTLKGDSSIGGYEIQSSPNMENVVANPSDYLQEATSFFYYNLEAWSDDQQPPHFVSLWRETHVSDLAEGEDTAIQIQLGYSDGFGRSLQRKVKVDDGPLTETDTTDGERWLVSGRTVYNNKEKPVKQYEPFYSGTHAYQSEEEVGPIGVTPIIYYDPLGRVIRTDTPKGFHSKVEFTSWETHSYDENDTVSDSNYYATHVANGDEESEALINAIAHYNTPTSTVMDVLGRTFLSIQRKEEGGEEHITYTEYDISGNALSITDPRQYAANASRTEEEQVKNFIHQYDLLGNALNTQSADAGESFVLNNVLGNAVHLWNARGYYSQTIYDALHRPKSIYVSGNELDQVVQQMEYGEGETDSSEKNLNGQMVRHYDQAGLLENELFDFKGAVLSTSRTLRSKYKTEVDWDDPSTVDMEAERFTTTMVYDAMGRVVEQIKPDGSITTPEYHQMGLLKSVSVQLQNESMSTAFIENITYDAKGQRNGITYGNGVQTSYAYEAETFRLTDLLTTRQEESGSITTLQDIHYVYDPVGNIVKITDASHQTIFTANQEVEAANDFVYDALYQLTQATGRQHLGLSKTDYQSSWEDYKGSHHASINDSQQLRGYIRNYSYDNAGNLTQIQHVGENAFTRQMTVAETSNRAITDEMDTSVDVDSYFDAAGNMIQLEHLEAIAWNYRNNIASVTIIERDTENDAEYYVYDSSGQRLRKVKETHNANGDLLWKEEKLYVAGLELKRRYQGNSETIRDERYSHHISDNARRIAIAYYWTLSSDSTVTINTNKLHYQLDNHLGSASLELDISGQIISYEEYFPFGGTAFTTGANESEVKLKEYRYTGKERDDTTGLYYYGARYYATWMGRWLSPDPSGPADGLNIYKYVSNNPINLVDPNGLQEAPPPMSEAQKSAWNYAEAQGYSDESVDNLISVIESERAESGRDFLTRQTALEYATVRGSAAVHQWEQGNYLSALGHGTAGIIESFGYTALGDTNTGTAGNVAFEVATAGVGHKVGQLMDSSRTGQVSLSFREGRGSNPAGHVVGHSRVGTKVDETAEEAWTHLRVPAEGREMMSGGGLVKSGDTLVESVPRPNPKTTKIVDVAVTPEQAKAAQRVADNAVESGSVGPYEFLANDCATYACADVLGAAGVPTLPVGTPATHYVTTKVYAGLTAPGTTGTLLAVASVPSVGMWLNDDPSFDSSDPSNYSTFEEFSGAQVGPYSYEYLMETWTNVHGR